jgi:hypothetical protein
MFGDVLHKTARAQREAAVADFEFVAVPAPWRADIVAIKKLLAPPRRTDDAAVPLNGKRVTGLNVGGMSYQT